MKGSVEFDGTAYTLSREDLGLIFVALTLLNPQNEKIARRARRLAVIFQVLSEEPVPKPPRDPK
jgi:hypothetical protein